MDDPVVGGYTPDKIALRRAIVDGLQRRRDDPRAAGRARRCRRRSRSRRACRATIRASTCARRYDSGAARALLDKFGYKDRDGDGFRELPDGKPLTLTMGVDAVGARPRSATSCGRSSMDALGIRIEFVKQKWPDLLKMARAGQLQMWPVGWINDLRRGRRVHGAAVQHEHRPVELRALQALPSTTTLYAQDASACPTAPERDALYARMAEIVAAYAPWDLGVYRIENTLVQPWVLGYKKHAYREHPWQYLDIDVAAARAPAK